VEAGKSKIIFNSSLSFYPRLITGDEGCFCQKNIPAEVEGSKKRPKSSFLENQKIFDCEPTSATGELKKEVNVRI
jgi:hypothetical protein